MTPPKSQDHHPPSHPRLSWDRPTATHDQSRRITHSAVARTHHPFQKHHFPISRISTCTYMLCLLFPGLVEPSKDTAPSTPNAVFLADSGELSL